MSNKKYWRKEKLKKMNVIGSEVILPFNEEGIVVDYVNYRFDWFPFKVKITKENLFNNIGDIVEFKREQITFKDTNMLTFFK